jgi:hypothetical protein
MNKFSKLDYPFDISIKMLYLAGKLLQEQGNFERIPGWLIETMDINNAALGTRVDKHCIVYFSQANRENEKKYIEVPTASLWCSCRESYSHRDVPCHILDCPVRQELLSRCELSGLDICVSPCQAGRIFNGVRQGPAAKFLSRFRNTQGDNPYRCLQLDTINRNRKSASYFLPSEDMAQMWSEMLAGLSHDLQNAPFLYQRLYHNLDAGRRSLGPCHEKRVHEHYCRGN